MPIDRLGLGIDADLEKRLEREASREERSASYLAVKTVEAMLRGSGEDDAIRAAALTQQGREIPFTSDLALEAAKPAHQPSLAMADAVIPPATARSTGATLSTQDADFEGVDGVRYFAKVSQ